MSREAEALAGRYCGRIAERGRAFFESYGDAELAILHRFIEGVVRLHEEEIENLAAPNKAK